MPPGPTFRVPARCEGPSGQGQGGWTAAQLPELIGQPVTVALRAPVPLDTDLTVEPMADDRWRVVAPDGTIVMTAARWAPAFPTTSAVSVADGLVARRRFPYSARNHPAVNCFSCGIGEPTMQVHAGPLGDGRFATDWTAPEAADRGDGSVDPALAWAATDCAAGTWIANTDGNRMAFTVQFAAEVLAPIEAGVTYCIVAWQGDHEPGWTGRKRGAASAAFDGSGRLVAQAVSFWVAPDSGLAMA